MAELDPHRTTVFRARKIITMNPSRPDADCVAVREGRILGAGPLGELDGWGDYHLDDRFADKILMPGLVESHSHLSFANTADLESLGAIPAEEHTLLTMKHAKLMLDQGFTSCNSAAAATPAAQTTAAPPEVPRM